MMTTFFINDEPQYWADGPPGPFVPLAEADALEAKIAALEAERTQLRAESDRLRAEVERLSNACEDALDWINDFGQHSSIAFGGEAELANKLTKALNLPGEQ